jgi:hypothetical protein
MSKDEIIDKLLIKHDVWLCGYTREQLEACKKEELERWLKNLEEEDV